MMKIHSSSVKMAFVCITGIILNLLGSYIAFKFNLPLYLDTAGTIFIAALCGYGPGIAVGFFTNLLETSFKISEMYFSLVNIFIAIVTAFLAQRGYYEKLSKVWLTIPITILVSNIFGAFIEELLDIHSSINFLGKLWERVDFTFSKDMIDKSLSIFFVFIALKFIPPGARQNLQMLGRMQAPLPDEVADALKASSNLVTSLRTKMIFSIISGMLFVVIAISSISYLIYKEFAVIDRVKVANGIISMVVSEIDPNKVDEFLKAGRQTEGYVELERRLEKIRGMNSDIKFLRVYKITEDGRHVIFDLDTPFVNGKKAGEIEPFDKYIYPYVKDLQAGRPIKPITSDDKYGYMLTVYKPVYDSQGKCVCYAAIDFSMDLISDYALTFIAKVIALFSGCLIFILVLSLSFIENNIVMPINAMAYCARTFAYDSEEARERNIERMKSLKIKTNDEIENLYSAFLKTTEDSMRYFESFKQAKIEVAVMDELAHKDALTGIKNKAAYNKEIAKLDADIEAGRAEFCMVMIDVNYLKRVNDTYGHERGNEYLINACELACSIFGRENVYRIGGDEFVAVLDGETAAQCTEKVARLRGAIEKFKADDSLEAWEKVSAAVGVAFYKAGVDKNSEEVFKRADSLMYQNKLEMKAVRKD